MGDLRCFLLQNRSSAIWDCYVMAHENLYNHVVLKEDFHHIQLTCFLVMIK